MAHSAKSKCLLYWPTTMSLSDVLCSLSVSEMMRLFGPVREDDRGREFIIVEDKETLPQYDADSEDEGDED